MFLRQEFLQLGQFVVEVRLPLAGELEDGEEHLGVRLEVLGELFDENIGAQPIEIADVLGAEGLVTGCAGFDEVGQLLGCDFGGGGGGGLIVAEEGAVAIVVLGACVEQG